MRCSIGLHVIVVLILPVPTHVDANIKVVYCNYLQCIFEQQKLWFATGNIQYLFRNTYTYMKIASTRKYRCSVDACCWTHHFYLGEKFRLELQQAMFTSAVLLCLQTACSKQDTVDSTLESVQGCNTEYQIHSVGPRYICGSHKVHIHIYTWLESQKASPPTTARSCSR